MDRLEGRFEPTPLYLLDTDASGNRLFIKREDLLPYSFGGNKVRIAIEYMRDMRSKGCDHMVTYGNARSNLCRVLSNLCAAQGVPITILSPADDDGARLPSFNASLCEAFGANIVPCLKTNVAQSVDAVFAALRQKGQRPYYTYGDRLGQGNEAVPTAAYVPMYAEIAAQEARLDASFEAVFLATGTGMTQAGLICGQLLAGAEARPWHIMGVSVARDSENAKAHIGAFANAYLKAAAKAQNMAKDLNSAAPLTPDPATALDRIEVYDAFRETYGQCGPEVARCIQGAMTRYGLPLDGTYTGKAFHGMEELIKGFGWQGRDILFMHTGGTPLFFDAAQAWPSA